MDPKRRTPITDGRELACCEKEITNKGFFHLEWKNPRKKIKEGKALSTQEKIQETLLGFQHIAVVGFSNTPNKPAYTIPRYLMKAGYTVFPVNPYAAEKHSPEKIYSSLQEIPQEVHLVLIFRPAEEVLELVKEILQRNDVQGIWMQEGIAHEQAALLAQEKGLLVVQNRCIYKEHQALQKRKNQR